jgi:hypothetical protein
VLHQLVHSPKGELREESDMYIEFV